MMTTHRWHLLLLALIFPVFFVSALAQSPPKREFRGIWLTTVGNGDWPGAPGAPVYGVQAQKDQLRWYLEELRSLGMNTVFFQVRPECDALYASTIEPWSFWLTGAQGVAPAALWDPLEFAINEAHKRGMELHAWLNPYRAVHASYRSYTRSPSHISNTHPEWILNIPDAKGTSIIDPGKAAVRQYVLSVVTDIVLRYDIDGVVMDDYFYVEGITTQDAATFTAESRGFTDLGDWRRDNVNLLVRGIFNTVNSLKPWVKFGMSPRGIWKNGVPSGITGNNNYSTIYCDAVAWLQGKYIDYFSPQLYWKFGGPQDYGKLEPWWATQLNGRIYCPSLAAFYIGDPKFGPASEVANQIRFNRTSGNAHGYVPFTANNITGRYTGTPSTGGIGDTLRNSLNTNPAIPPVYVWKDTLAPFPPRAFRFARLEGTAIRGLLWDVPAVAADGDSASRYVVYRFDHAPTLPDELSDARNIITLVGERHLTPATPPTGGTRFFVVTSLDRNNNESGPSNVLELGVPPVPLLASPASGTTAVLESTALAWQDVSLASSYHLQGSADSTFSSGLFVNDSTITDTTRIVRGYPGQKRVFWRVRAANAVGASPFAMPFSFVSGIPGVASLVSPSNAAPDQLITPTLRWATAEAARSYRIQLATNATFSPTLVDTTGVVDTTLSSPALEYFKIYFWRVKASNAAGAADWSTAFRFRTVQMTTVEQETDAPTEYALYQNYPNPFNPTTSIQFAVPRQVRVTIKVYDILGREEAALVNEEMPAGTYTVRFDASRFASGMYFYRMTAGEFAVTKRLMVVK